MKERKKYYRMLDDEDTFSLDNKHNIGQLTGLARQFVKQNRYFYIDMQQGTPLKYSESKLKMMEECSSSQDEQQTEELGSHYISNLTSGLSSNSKRVLYLFRMKEQTKRKENALKLLSEQKKQTQKRANKLKRIVFNREQVYGMGKRVRKDPIYKSMNPEVFLLLLQLLKKYQMQDELRGRNQLLAVNEERLLKHYSTIPTHRSLRIKNEKGKSQGKSKLKYRQLLPMIFGANQKNREQDVNKL